MYPKGHSMVEPTDLAKEYPPRVKRIKVGGVKVERDEPVLSGLSARHGKTIVFDKQRLLTLADGTQVFGCNVCDFTGTRGELNTHIQADHPSNRPKPARAKGKTAVDPIDQLPEGLADKTLRELFTLSAHQDAWGDILAGAEALAAEREALYVKEKAEHSATKRELAALRKKVKALFGSIVETDEKEEAKS